MLTLSALAEVSECNVFCSNVQHWLVKMSRRCKKQLRLALSGENTLSVVDIVLVSGPWLFAPIGRLADLTYQRFGIASAAFVSSSDVRSRRIPLLISVSVIYFSFVC